MISNIDIERRKNASQNITEINQRISKLVKLDVEVLKSKKFSNFMVKLIKAYSSGKDGIKLPLFAPKNFATLVISKFNSYELESFLIYDFTNNQVFFKPRNVT